MTGTMSVGPMDVFWVFITFTSLQAMVKQRWAETGLMALFPQPVRSLPTVEYLPGRRVAEGAREATAWQA